MKHLLSVEVVLGPTPNQMQSGGTTSEDLEFVAALFYVHDIYACTPLYAEMCNMMNLCQHTHKLHWITLVVFKKSNGHKSPQ